MESPSQKDINDVISFQLHCNELLQLPTVKPFSRGKISVTECAISTILSLVSHEKPAHSTNQAGLFDYILNRENQVNRLAIYHERRFNKLGYSAESILQSLPFIRMLINKTHLSNQHVEVVKLLLYSEFLVTELNLRHFLTLLTR